MKWGKKIAAGVLAAVTTVSIAACGGGDNGGSSSGPTKITVWSWSTTLPEMAKVFNKENPDIEVEVTNAGSALQEYQALNNAISAGSGAPDIAMIEYYALPQYIIGDALYDLSEFGAGDYSDFYTPGTWSSVTSGDGVYALPLDSGPMALFYNKDTFEKAGITEPPATMDEYYEDAKKIRALGDDYYITTDSGESAPEELMMWVAGGTPFKVDGENLSIDLTKDKGAKTFVDWWQKLVDEDLIDTGTLRWSEEWQKKLNDGTCASLTIGAWMTSMIADNAPDTKGQWRVAPTPVFDENNPVNGEDGGSSLAVISSTKNAEAAWKFVDWCAHDKEGIKMNVDANAFPADLDTLQSEEFQSAANEYFGDQEYNKVLVESANAVSTDWQFLPYDVYARNIYGDYFGPAARGDSTYAEAMKGWEKALIDYGKQQGYTVNGEK